MRIVYLCPATFPEKKSHAIQILNTCEALAHAGARVELIVRKLRGTPAEVLSHYHLEPHPNLVVRMASERNDKVRRWDGRPFLWYLYRLMLRNRLAGEPTAYYMRGTARILELIPRLAPLARLLRAPLVFELHAIQYNDAIHMERYRAKVLASGNRAHVSEMGESLEQYQEIARRREARAYECLSGIVSISKPLCELATQHFGVRCPMLVAPSGVKLGASSAKRQPSAHIDKAGDVDVCYVGGLYEFNGVDILVEAMAGLPGRRLAVVGDGEEGDLERSRATAHRAGVEDRVEFLGHRPHPEALAWMRRSRVVVAPTRRGLLERAEIYCSPGKLGEYMASGGVVVATRTPAHETFLTDGQNAILVEPNSPQAMADGIRQALENKQISEQLAEQAFADAQELTFDARARKIIEFLEKLQRA